MLLVLALVVHARAEEPGTPPPAEPAPEAPAPAPPASAAPPPPPASAAPPPAGAPAAAPTTLHEAIRQFRAQDIRPPTPPAPWAKAQFSQVAGTFEVASGPALVAIGWLDGNFAAIDNDNVSGQWAATALVIGGGLGITVDGTSRMILAKRWKNALRAEAWGLAPGRYPDPVQAERGFHLGMAISNGASGALLLAGGIGLLGMSGDLQHDYPGEPDASYARVTGASLATEGALCIAAGAVHLVTMGHRPAAISLAPIVDGTHTGMKLGGTF